MKKILLIVFLMMLPLNIAYAAGDDLYIIDREETGSGRAEISILDGDNIDSTGEWCGESCQWQKEYVGYASPHGNRHNDGLSYTMGCIFYDDELPTRNEYNHPFDIYAINSWNTGSGRTEVYILDGVHWFDNIRRSYATPLPLNGAGDFVYEAGGEISDNYQFDIYAIKKANTGSGRVEVHILDGTNDYQSFKLHASTPLPEIGFSHGWHFKIGRWGADDRDDGVVDLFAIKTGHTDSGMVEVFIIDGADNFQSFRKHLVTDLPVPPFNPDMYVDIGDYDDDRITDIYFINDSIRRSSSGNIEVTVLPGTHEFRSHSTFETGKRSGQAETFPLGQREIFMAPKFPREN
jgi:hypothetical protein